MEFQPPKKAEQLAAIGSLAELPAKLKIAFDPEFDFQDLPIPQPGDWLAVYGESGQTYDAYVHSCPPQPRPAYSRIYLQPLGEFSPGQSPALEILRDYAEAYFCLPAQVLPPLNLSSWPITSRRNFFTGKIQLLTTDILNKLIKKIPSDAFCLLAVTMEDLYPEPSWNFVFGQAFLSCRIGVFSFARYDPAFYGLQRGKDYTLILLQRSCKVLGHEIGHMFFLAHCIYFHCLMNGSNHLAESDARPFHLCPVCLRKLHFSIGFDVEKRYEKLLLFYQSRGFQDEAKWVAKRLKRIRDLKE